MCEFKKKYIHRRDDFKLLLITVNAHNPDGWFSWVFSTDTIVRLWVKVDILDADFQI